MVKPRLGTHGALQVPMAILIAVFAASSLSIWICLHQWRKKTELQLRLDTCVGKTAHALRSTQRSIERSNREIEVLRITLSTAMVLGQPEVSQAAETALRAEVLYQEVLLAKWKTQQLTWIAKRGCDSENDIPIPLPNLDWYRNPPDTIGLQPLSWPTHQPKSVVLRLSHPPRHAAAEVKEETHEKTQWIANWTNLY